MKPLRTIYRLADSEADYAACRQLSGRYEALDWPVIIAERDDRTFLGFASANLTGDIVQLGHLLTTAGPHAPTVCLRLVEAWENVLAAAGVQEYFFGVEHDNPRLLTLVEQLAMRPYSELEHVTWYKRSPQRIGGTEHGRS